MTILTWDGTGERKFETGVDQGVLFPTTTGGVYGTGVAWNGLVSVTDSPSGAESNPQYADNIKYLDLRGPEELGGTIEAFTHPDAFAECDGSVEPTPGLVLNQQGRKKFGFSYRTKKGNDADGMDAGYLIHIWYGCTANPSEKQFSTVNDSPEAVTFSWEVTTDGVATAGRKPVASLVLDSTKLTPAKLKLVTDKLYGTAAATATLPLPAEIITMVSGA